MTDVLAHLPDLDSLPLLDEPYALDPAAPAELQANGHTVVRGLASAAEVTAFRPAIEALVRKHADRVPSLEDRDTYGKAFLQVPNLWTRSEVIKRFVFAQRFAKVAAELMGVPAVRLYHDQALCKEPGGGFTPWHQDQNYWPLETDKTITMWMALVDVPPEVGTMTFASGSHTEGDLGPWVIGDDSERGFGGVVEDRGFAADSHGAARAGDATFHTGWTVHRAPANGSDLLRSVMTVIYFADGTRVGGLDSAPRQFDNQIWLDNKAEGDVADGPLNPVLWPPAA